MKKIIVNLLIAWMLFMNINDSQADSDCRYSDNSEYICFIVRLIEGIDNDKAAIEAHLRDGRRVTQLIDEAFVSIALDSEKIKILKARLNNIKRDVGSENSQKTKKLLFSYILWKIVIVNQQIDYQKSIKYKNQITSSEDIYELSYDDFNLFLLLGTVDNLEKINTQLYPDKKFKKNFEFEKHISSNFKERNQNRSDDLEKISWEVFMYYRDHWFLPQKEVFFKNDWFISYFDNDIYPHDPMLWVTIGNCKFWYKYELYSANWLKENGYRLSSCMEDWENATYTETTAAIISLNSGIVSSNSSEVESDVIIDNITDSFYIWINSEVLEWEDLDNSILERIYYTETNKRAFYSNLIEEKYLTFIRQQLSSNNSSILPSFDDHDIYLMFLNSSVYDAKDVAIWMYWSKENMNIAIYNSILASSKDNQKNYDYWSNLSPEYIDFHLKSSDDAYGKIILTDVIFLKYKEERK